MSRFHLFALMILTGAAARAAEDPVASFILFKAPTVALVHAQLIDGTGGRVRNDQTIVIRDDRVVAVGDGRDTPVPRGALVRDLHGAAVTPGFVLLHEHLFYPLARGANYGAEFGSFPGLYLAGGVTTLRTGGSVSPYADLNAQRDIEVGQAIGPDMDVTAPYIEGANRFIAQMVRLTSDAESERMVRYWAEQGATSFKGYMHLTRAQLGAAIRAAHEYHRKFTAHLCAVSYREAADLGIDDLEHGFLVATDFVQDRKPDECPDGDTAERALDGLAARDPRMDDLQRHLIEARVTITSTLTVFETFAYGRPMAPEGALNLLIPELREEYIDTYTRIQRRGPNLWSSLLPKAMAWEKQFSDAGGLLVAGTDPTGYGGVLPGFSAVRQVELMMEAGFDLPGAVRIATLNGAVYLGREADIGTLAAGKRADLVVFSTAIDARDTRLPDIAWTMKSGVAFDRTKILAKWQHRVGLN